MYHAEIIKAMLAEITADDHPIHGIYITLKGTLHFRPSVYHKIPRREW